MESGLMVIGRTQIDNNQISKFVDSGDYHAQWYPREGFWFFPEDEENYDELESELESEFVKLGINATFEGIFEHVKPEIDTLVENYQRFFKVKLIKD